MKTYHWSGEYWYERDWSLFHRIRNWFIWIGGWEKANEKGWQIIRHCTDGRTELWSPFPVSMLDHRVTFYGWGWDVKVGKRWLVYSRRENHLYLSSDGTPDRATTWLSGTPKDIVAAAQNRG